MSSDWWAMTWLVARREIKDRGRARSFWIASVVLLVAVAAGAIVPALLSGGKTVVQIGVVGTSVASLSATAREAGRISGSTVIVEVLPSVAAAKAGLRSGSLAAVLVGDTEVLVNKQPVTGGTSTGTTLAEIGGVQRLYAELPPAAALALARQGIALPVRSLSAPTRGLASRFTGLVAVILIYVIILTYGIRITIGVGEEKSTRVVEVLLTTLRPVQLLAGKVIGIGLLALAQIAAMVAVFLLLGHAVGSPEVRGADTGIVLVSGLWLVLGYAFYCTAYAAAGSLITRQADAYNAALPLQIPLLVTYVLVFTVIYSNTVNPFFHVLAFIPFTAPVAMPVLVAVGAAPAWQVAVAALISVAATAWMARLAGTIYGRAILRTGSKLTVRQVLRSAA